MRVSLVSFAVACGVLLACAPCAGEAPLPAKEAATLGAVLEKVATDYVEPSRVDPKRMLWGAAVALDREVPEVLLESSRDQEPLTLSVAGAKKSFRTADVRTLRALERTVGEILGFVAANRVPGSKPSATYAAINGMLATLDPHSLLFNPAEAKEFSTNVANRFSGIGIVYDSSGSNESGANPGVPVVVKVMKGGPAEQAGIERCDRILAVDDLWAFGLDFDQLVGALRGPTGSPVWITLQRDGLVRDIVVTRAQIVLESVTSRRLDGDVGLIRIDRFVSGTGAEVRVAVADLRKAGVTSWILDLRDNPGGLLSQAIAAAGVFLHGGPVITVLGEAGRNREVKSVKPDGPVEEGPLAVLIGPFTASAAEVLASGLQMRNRATIFGQTSFGKGSVQVLYDEKDGSKLKLTIAHYLTPGGASLQSRGIVPDVELLPVPPPRKGRVRVDAPRPAFREADLDRAFAPREASKRPEVSLRYFAATPDGEEEVRIAHELHVRVRPAARGDALTAGAPLFREARAAEESKIAGALEEAGVDWSDGPARDASPLKVRCTQSGAVERDRVPIECEVRNDGPSDALRVFGRSSASGFDLRDEEIVVGRVPAGTSKRVSLEGALARDPYPRISYVPFSFSSTAGSGGRPVETDVRIDVPARKRPAEGSRAAEIVLAVDAPAETESATLRVKANARSPLELLDAWVTVSNDFGQNDPEKLERKKAGYFPRTSPAAGDGLEIAVDVPLRPGLNQIGVCAREKNGEERCERVFVYRLTP
jgi:carboxyl-terminal processing protease